jgi:hypothetical protein
MFEKQRKMRWLWPARRMDAANRKDGRNGRQAPSGPLAWYFARREEPAPRYGLTVNGYLPL